jgi:hypothetical protein
MFVSIRRAIAVCAFALSFVGSLVLGAQSAQAQDPTITGPQIWTNYTGIKAGDTLTFPAAASRPMKT